MVNISLELPLSAVPWLYRAMRSGAAAISVTEVNSGVARDYCNALDEVRDAVTPMCMARLFEFGWWIGRIRDCPDNVPKSPQDTDPDAYLAYHQAWNVYAVCDDQVDAITRAIKCMMLDPQRFHATVHTICPDGDKRWLLADVAVKLRTAKQKVQDTMNRVRAYTPGEIERIEAAAFNQIVDAFVAARYDVIPQPVVGPPRPKSELSTAVGLRAVMASLLSRGYMAKSTGTALVMTTDTMEVQLLSAEERIKLRNLHTERQGELTYTTAKSEAEQIIAHVMAVEGRCDDAPTAGS